eukprot:CAMPEP_0206005810 /NCGR_PEP_ID=MMETSP1464-20131121/4808_1 /ASSEMBLY_ACC=CAM_ASM_001124 /TAXON_ID=119497 /ORGANISM="Exanthemachrysis gayraliae, Strain RCC1523" /LENGTH=210 /DNA_ID=CAMNT_0053379269 /DNA_START=30 /DNA_END=659 /DNA_ORIENTATION=+
MDVEQGKSSGPTLGFEDLRFSVGDKEILKGLTAEIKAGEVVAILGPSGAGKTSLLNILAGRVLARAGREIKGKVTLDGEPVNPRTYRTDVAYVMQEDALMPFTTPREALRFSARLRRPREESVDAKEAAVEGMLASLRLQNAADTYVGNAFVKGLSGGEKKRTAIGVELVTGPDVCFADEPTSGLDSFSAAELVDQLKGIAQEGKIVVCT